MSIVENFKNVVGKSLMNGRAKFRLFLLFVLAGVVGVLAFLVLRERDPMPPYLEAMKAYAEEGAALEQQGKNGDAAAKYGEACVLLEIAYKRLDVSPLRVTPLAAPPR